MIDDYIKVKDKPGLVRDGSSKAVLVVDDAARQNYINQRTIAQRAFNASEELRGEVDELKNEIKDVKSILSQILSKLDR